VRKGIWKKFLDGGTWGSKVWGNDVPSFLLRHVVVVVLPPFGHHGVLPLASLLLYPMMAMTLTEEGRESFQERERRESGLPRRGSVP